MGELVPDEFSVVPRGIFQGRIGRAPVPSDHPVPIAQAGIDMGRHVERMGIARSGHLVPARDVQPFSGSGRRVVGVDEVMHGARVVRIPVVHPEKDFGGPIGTGS